MYKSRVFFFIAATSVLLGCEIRIESKPTPRASPKAEAEQKTPAQKNCWDKNVFESEAQMFACARQMNNMRFTARSLPTKFQDEGWEEGVTWVRQCSTDKKSIVVVRFHRGRAAYNEPGFEFGFHERARIPCKRPKGICEKTVKFGAECVDDATSQKSFVKDHHTKSRSDNFCKKPNEPCYFRFKTCVDKKKYEIKHLEGTCLRLSSTNRLLICTDPYNFDPRVKAKVHKIEKGTCQKWTRCEHERYSIACNEIPPGKPKIPHWIP